MNPTDQTTTPMDTADQEQLGLAFTAGAVWLLYSSMTREGFSEKDIEQVLVGIEPTILKAFKDWFIDGNVLKEFMS